MIRVNTVLEGAFHALSCIRIAKHSGNCRTLMRCRCLARLSCAVFTRKAATLTVLGRACSNGPCVTRLSNFFPIRFMDSVHYEPSAKGGVHVCYCRLDELTYGWLWKLCSMLVSFFGFLFFQNVDMGGNPLYF